MRVVVLLCVLAVTGLSEARAVFDVFLRVTSSTEGSIVGDAPDAIYQGWNTVFSFEAGAKRNAQGSTALLPLTLVKTVDRATPIFFDQLARGTDVTIKMVVVLRTPQRVELWDIACHSSVFTGQTFTGGSGSELLERLGFEVGRFEWSYIQISPAGDAQTEVFANWSLITNSGTFGTRLPDFQGGIDTDGDGIPDGWENFYGLDFRVADSSRDTDGDGLSNLKEFIAHTNPRLAQSTLRVTALRGSTPGSYQLTWQSVAGLNYRVESAPAPGGPWTFVKSVASSGTGTTSTVVNGASPATFYRVATP